MFQDMLVKIRKMTARLYPACPGMIPEIAKITNGKNPRMGMDWSTSRSGMMTVSARWFRAAMMPTVRLKRMLKTSAIIILLQE
jgi:hypothetical protein